MKITITILLILIVHVSYGQCAGMKNDTVPHTFITGQKLFNYYNRDGSLRWGNKNEYDSSLMDLGGSFTITIKSLTTIKGYRVYTTDDKCKMKVIGFLDAKYKPIIPKSPKSDATVLL